MPATAQLTLNGRHYDVELLISEFLPVHRLEWSPQTYLAW